MRLIVTTPTNPSWADEMFGAGPSRPAKVFTSLAAVLHPDHGGDLRLYGELRDAYARYLATNPVIALRTEDSGDEKLFRELREAYERYPETHDHWHEEN